MKNSFMNKSLSFLLLITAVTFLASCTNFKEFEGLEVGNYEGEFAVPLFQSSISFEQLLEDVNEGTELIVEEDGAMRLYYLNDPKIRRTEDIFEIIPIFGAALEDTINNIPLGLPEEVDIQRMIFSDGNIGFSFKSFHEDDLSVVFTLPQVSRNGQTFQRTFNVDYEGTLPVEKTGVFSLKTWELMPGGTDSLIIRYEAIRSSNGERDTLTEVQMGVVNLEFSYAEGFLGTETYDVDSATIDMDFFETWASTDVFFEDPKVIVLVENSFGFPVRSDTRKLFAETYDGQILQFENEGVTNGINFEYPGFDEIGETKMTTYVLDKDNSNIRDIVAAGPRFIEYVIDAITNPEEDPSQIGFLTDSSFFQVQVAVDIPIWGSVKNYGAQDTFDISFESFNNIKEVEFKIVAENEIPLEAELQMFFVDAEGTVLDSMFVDPSIVIPGAPVDDKGLVTGEVEEVTFTTFDAARFERIRAATGIIAETSFSTWQMGGPSVRLNAKQTLELRVGMKATYQE
jgi:hypothetical protein